MLELSPLNQKKLWGYEDWIASTHTDCAQKEFLSFAGDFPLIVKIIQADKTLSVQLHPDNENARILEGGKTSGKTECWLILDAKPDSKIVSGFKENYTADEIKTALENDTFENLLQYRNVKKGDFIYIPAGTVHAIGGGIRLLEIQQSSNITYRLYDWKRGRELHVEKSLAVLKNMHEKNSGNSFATDGIKPLGEEFDCPYFSLQKIDVKGGYSFFAAQTQLVFVLSGSFECRWEEKNGTKGTVKSPEAESIFALSPKEKVTFEGNGQIIRIKLPEQE